MSLDPDDTIRNPRPPPSGVSVAPALDASLQSLAGGQGCFGHYTLIRYLNQGSMGVVWLAEDRRLKAPVALKFLPELVTQDTSALDDLKRETLRSLELSHEHIVRIRNFEEDLPRAAIAMEYVDGASLAELRETRPGGVFSPAEILPWVEQLAAALDYAHREKQVVHRDLKPANLMVSTASGKIKVMDFGISAKISGDATRTMRKLSGSGSPSYMSPQQFREGKAAVSDDIYAFGATLYELLTGKPPFEGDIFAIIAKAQTEIPPELTVRRAEVAAKLGRGGEVAAWSDIPAEWETVVAACLAKNAEDRPASAREVAKRLRQGLGGVPAEVAGTAPTTPPMRVVPPAPRVPVAPAVPRLRLAVVYGIDPVPAELELMPDYDRLSVGGARGGEGRERDTLWVPDPEGRLGGRRLEVYRAEEGSGAVLRCLPAGLPVWVNRNRVDPGQECGLKDGDFIFLPTTRKVVLRIHSQGS